MCSRQQGFVFISCSRVFVAFIQTTQTEDFAFYYTRLKFSYTVVVGEVEKTILASLDAFVGFARKRLSDPELAADAVQESLLKALRTEAQPQETEKIVPWFYRILRRTIVDLYRERQARERLDEKARAGVIFEQSDEDQSDLCDCFRSLLLTMPPQYRSLLERVDLEGEAPKEVAADLGIAWNNLNVRLHRARAALRSRLEDACQACSKHGCLNCTCAPHEQPGT